MTRNIMGFAGGKKAAVGDITTELVLLGVIGVAGWYIFSKMGGSAQDKAQAANNQAAAANTAAANQQTLDQVTATGQQPTLTASKINNMANALASLVQQGPDDTDDSRGMFSAGVPTLESANSQAANTILMQVNNLVDWQKLVSAFGTRQDYNNNTVDLVTGVREIVAPATLNNLDSFYYAQGIGWQFTS